VSVLHQDANDFNVLVRDDGSGAPRISGIIDFGDATSGRRANELAVALAYALLDVPDVAATARRMIGGYGPASAGGATSRRWPPQRRRRRRPIIHGRCRRPGGAAVCVGPGRVTPAAAHDGAAEGPRDHRRREQPPRSRRVGHRALA
jgi:hypothetical protein